MSDHVTGDPRLDIDLYCLNCGYNLRGLDGDPIRCPECAFRNAVGDVEVPAEAITRHVAQLETALTSAAAAAIVAATWLAGAYFVLPSLWSMSPWSSFALMLSRGIALLALALPAVWAACVWRVRALCLARRGWIAALLKHHFYASTLVVLVAAPLALCVWFLIDATGSKLGFHVSAWYYIGSVVGVAAMLTLIHFTIRPLYDKLKATIGPLRREIAAELARDHGRRQLSRALRT